MFPKTALFFWLWSRIWCKSETPETLSSCLCAADQVAWSLCTCALRELILWVGVLWPPFWQLSRWCENLLPEDFDNWESGVSLRLPEPKLWLPVDFEWLKESVDTLKKLLEWVCMRASLCSSCHFRSCCSLSRSANEGDCTVWSGLAWSTLSSIVNKHRALQQGKSYH